MSVGLSISLLIIMNFFWAGSYAVVKDGLSAIDPLGLIFWRHVAALPIIALWLGLARPSLRLSANDIVRIVAAGLLVAVSHLLWVSGIELSHATDASLLYVFEPVWGILLAWIFLKEPMRSSAVAGLLLALAGFASLSGIDLAHPASALKGVGLGNALVVAGLLAEGCFSIVLKPVAVRQSAPVVIAGFLLVTCSVLAVPLTLRGGLSVPVAPKALMAIGYLSLICTSLGYTLWVSVMKYVPVGVMLFTVFIQPLTGPLIAALTIGEPLDGRVAVGGAMLVAGMAVAVIGHFRAAARDRAELAPDVLSIPANA